MPVGISLDYEQSPIFPQGQQSEQNASARENQLFSRALIFTRVLLALLSLRENWGLLVVQYLISCIGLWIASHFSATSIEGKIVVLQKSHRKAYERKRKLSTSTQRNFKRAHPSRAFVGHLSFRFEKLQMPHGGAGRSHKKPHGGA